MPFLNGSLRPSALSLSVLSMLGAMTLGISTPIHAQTLEDAVQNPSAVPSKKLEYNLPKQALTPEIAFNSILADILLQRGKPQEAYMMYMRTAALTRDPRYAELAYKIAAALGAKDPALTAAKLLKELAPNTQLGQDLKTQNDIQRAYGQIDAQQYRPAYETAKIILKDSPDNVPALGLLADVADRLGYNNEALAALEKLVKIDPNNPEHQNALGYFLADKNMRLPEAKTLIEKAIAQKPAAPHIIDSLAWINYRLGNLDTALQLVEQSLVQEPHDEVKIHYGEILWASGQQEKALSVLRQVYETSPFLPNLRDTAERLNIPMSQLQRIQPRQ
ncbi:tetratricopeptide repeat protein [Hydromonas duriensis]|uniref:Tetratricopeptide repeat protein n=1 Tax=Hydromonas duriensis TaxID=1527608 RepID=A0A4R6Y9D4_9BURK|nr:tetratricopeptide repeat protein [Hydromonas duriensis]TDR32036.1 tetratricopeptide repeat protein [Hydromonas duriensis]